MNSRIKYSYLIMLSSYSPWYCTKQSQRIKQSERSILRYGVRDDIAKDISEWLKKAKTPWIRKWVEK